MAIKVEKGGAPRGEEALPRSHGEPGIMGAMTWPLDLLLRYQGDLLRAMEPEAMRWFARRQEDVQAGLLALERLSVSVDIDARIDVQRNWLNGAIERLQGDLATLSCRWALPAAAATSGGESAARREARPSRGARTDEHVTAAD